MAAVRARSAATRLLMFVFRMDRVGSLPRRLRSLLLLFPMLQLHIVSNGPSGSLPRRLRSLLLLFPMFQLRSASNGPSV